MSDTTLSFRAIGLARAAIGVFQGLALYLIYLAYDNGRLGPRQTD